MTKLIPNEWLKMYKSFELATGFKVSATIKNKPHYNKPTVSFNTRDEIKENPITLSISGSDKYVSMSPEMAEKLAKVLLQAAEMARNIEFVEDN